MPESTELPPDAAEKIVTPEATFRKTQRAFIAHPSGANYNALMIAARAYQSAYIAAFHAEVESSNVKTPTRIGLA